jgi:hypothetical protein
MRLSISKNRSDSLQNSLALNSKFNYDYFQFELNKKNDLSKLEQDFLNYYKGLLRQASHRNQNDSHMNAILSLSDFDSLYTQYYNQSIKLNKASSRYISLYTNANIDVEDTIILAFFFKHRIYLKSIAWLPIWNE